MRILKVITVASAMTLAGGLSASAALLDFTSDATGNSGTLSDLNGTGYTLSAQGGPGFKLKRDTEISVTEAAAVPASAGLALDNDGVGVVGEGSRDEVTNGNESLLLEFTDKVKLTAVHFLDLFVGNKAEFSLTRNGATNQLIVKTVAVDGIDSGNAGYATSDEASFLGNAIVTSIRFVAGAAADNNDGDFALAAIEYDADFAPGIIPLPAGGVLLIGALGALGLVRRRKTA